MTAERTPEVEARWRAHCARHGVDADQRNDVFASGNSAEQGDRLLDLVRHGPKRATAGLHENFDQDDEPVPVIGTYSVLLDSAGHPAAVIRTTDVEVKPMSDVDEAFAWDEGEGGRGLAYGMRTHRNFCTNQRSERPLVHRRHAGGARTVRAPVAAAGRARMIIRSASPSGRAGPTCP